MIKRIILSQKLLLTHSRDAVLDMDWKNVAAGFPDLWMGKYPKISGM